MSRGGKREGAGRPKGSINKTSEEIRLAFLELVYDNLEQMHEDLMELTPYQRLKVVTGLLGKVLPTKVESTIAQSQPVEFVLEMPAGVIMPNVE